MSSVYQIDGLLILGVVLMAVTLASAIRGLHSRSAPLNRVMAAPAKKSSEPPKPRQAA
jgi:hypothetical protein